MSISSSDSVWSIGTTRVVVPVGNTLAVFCQPQQGQLGWNLKLLAGGTLEILSTGIGSSVLNLNFGTTLSGAALVTLTGSGWPLSISSPPETMRLNGPASFYLNALGATSIVAMAIYKGQGY